MVVVVLMFRKQGVEFLCRKKVTKNFFNGSKNTLKVLEA